MSFFRFASQPCHVLCALCLFLHIYIYIYAIISGENPSNYHVQASSCWMRAYAVAADAIECPTATALAACRSDSIQQGAFVAAQAEKRTHPRTMDIATRGAVLKAMPHFILHSIITLITAHGVGPYIYSSGNRRAALEPIHPRHPHNLCLKQNSNRCFPKANIINMR